MNGNIWRNGATVNASCPTPNLLRRRDSVDLRERRIDFPVLGVLRFQMLARFAQAMSNAKYENRREAAAGLVCDVAHCVCRLIWDSPDRSSHCMVALRGYLPQWAADLELRSIGEQHV